MLKSQPVAVTNHGQNIEEARQLLLSNSTKLISMPLTEQERISRSRTASAKLPRTVQKAIQRVQTAMKKSFLSVQKITTWRVWRPGVSARERLRVGLLFCGALIATLSTIDLGVAPRLLVTAIGVGVAFLLAWLSFALGFDIVTAGRDRIVLRSLRGRVTILGQDIRGFRYVGKLPYAQEWFVETRHGSVSLGTGKWSNPIVGWIMETLPNLQRPDPTWVDSLGTGDQYRAASPTEANLLEMVKLPSLSNHERRRIASIVATQGEEGRRVVEEVAEGCVDEEERIALKRLTR